MICICSLKNLYDECPLHPKPPSPPNPLDTAPMPRSKEDLKELMARG